MNKQIFDLGNFQIEANVKGTGEVILLIPGLGSEASAFDKFTPYLNKEGYKTVAINLRGIADSTGSLEEITLHDLANDVAKLISHLDEDGVHILGWAYGNRVARCVAGDYGHLIKSVILLAAGGKARPDPEAMQNLSKLYTAKSRKERLEAAKLSLFSPSTDPETILQAMRSSRSWPKAISAHSKANRVTPIDDWWGGGNAPMLVIQGIEDQIAPLENGNILKKEYGERIKLVNIENAAHYLFAEQPEMVANKVISFLSDFKKKEKITYTS